MGYTTDFSGQFTVNKTLDADTLTFLTKLNETRRMKRNVKGFGLEGCMFVDGGGDMGQEHDATVVDYNSPPADQPSLWCQWRPTEDGEFIAWDGNEKFYNYVEWIEWIIVNVLAPRGYALTGDVTWQGEDADDMGMISIVNNNIQEKKGRVVYGEEEPVKAKPVKAKPIKGTVTGKEFQDLLFKSKPVKKKKKS